MDLQKMPRGMFPSRFQVGFLSEQQKKYRLLFEAWSLAEDALQYPTAKGYGKPRPLPLLFF